MIKLLRLVLLFTSGLILLCCAEDAVNNPVGNQPPNTGLFLYPDSTITQQPSRLKVHWWGDDPDGIIVGFYFMWEGIDSSWIFTVENDSTFSLPIGSADTTYKLMVSAVDGSGNSFYDNEVIQNGINYGSEPFIDENGNGVFDEGEKFYDLGLIDPTPASLIFPIKNTPPVLEWSELSFLPDSSFPVMTFRWNADDLDGVETIESINIALNDTNNFVTLDGSIRLITLRIKDVQSFPPEMEIMINGSDQNIFPELLSGLILDAENKFYVQAVDLSGAESNRIVLPDSNEIWYVKKPKGKVLIFDDLTASSSNLEATLFYRNMFGTIGGGSLAGKYDEYDLANQVLPFENLTLFETIRLFPYTFWYSGSSPSLDLLNIVTNKYLQQGGKIAFSLTLQDSSLTFPFDLSTLQGFLPIDSVSAIIPQGFLLPGADVLPASVQVDYPPLKTSVTIAFVRTFTPNSVITTEIYELINPQISGTIGFITTDKSRFFIGLPLHQCNGGDQNVDELLDKVFFEEFGLVP